MIREKTYEVTMEGIFHIVMMTIWLMFTLFFLATGMYLMALGTFVFAMSNIISIKILNLIRYIGYKPRTDV